MLESKVRTLSLAEWWFTLGQQGQTLYLGTKDLGRLPNASESLPKQGIPALVVSLSDTTFSMTLDHDIESASAMVGVDPLKAESPVRLKHQELLCESSCCQTCCTSQIVPCS